MGRQEREETVGIKGRGGRRQDLRVMPGEAPIDGSLLREIMEREGMPIGQQDSRPLPKQEQ